MNRKEFITYVAHKNGIPKTGATYYVNMVLDSMTAAINNNEELALYGFGTFRKEHREPHRYKHPKTGEMCLTTGRDTLKFIPGKSFELGMDRDVE